VRLSRSLFTVIALAAGLAFHDAAAADGKPQVKSEEEPLKLPDLQVIADPLHELQFPAKGELTPADFSAHGAEIDVPYSGHAYYEGITEGNAAVGVMLDREGHPTDFLVLRYTKSYFGEALLKGARLQKYAAKRIHGVAVPGPFNFTYMFAPPTRVVYMSSFDASNQRREQVTGGLKFIYEPHREAEVDGGRLEPTRLAIPVVPAGFDASKQTSPKVLVSFYVDEEGRLRLPSVDSSASPALIENAVDALQQWRFKPPAIKGKGVLVYAMRVVKFRAGPPAAAPARP
jgi:TonB family protein